MLLERVRAHLSDLQDATFLILTLGSYDGARVIVLIDAPLLL